MHKLYIQVAEFFAYMHFSVVVFSLGNLHGILALPKQSWSGIHNFSATEIIMLSHELELKSRSFCLNKNSSINVLVKARSFCTYLSR